MTRRRGSKDGEGLLANAGCGLIEITSSFRRTAARELYEGAGIRPAKSRERRPPDV